VEASALQAPVGLARLSLSAPLLRLRSDEQLVALFRAGNEEAFRVIHDRYSQRLFAYARQMLSGSRQDAEDALQDVFIRAYSALRASDRPIALKAWLYRVAHNRCVDQLRRPLPPVADVFDVSRTPLSDPLSETERREDLRRLVEDVRRLPEQQRSVLLMREMEGLSYAELAGALDVSVPAVKSLLVRARMGLVEAIDARETACAEIRHDLSLAHGRGVRATGRARRHLRDCPGCRDYRRDLRRVQRSFAALTPAAAGPLGLLAKLGIGGGGAGGGASAATGGGAVAGGGVAAGGGMAAGGTIAGTGAAALSATKVAAVVSAVVVAGGGAVKVEQSIVESRSQQVAPAKTAPAAAAPAAIGVRDAAAHAVDAPVLVRPPAEVVADPVAETAAPATELTGDPAASEEEGFVAGSGGMAAPEESTGDGAGSAPTTADPREALAPATEVAPLEASRPGDTTSSPPAAPSSADAG
jgi:RNA polymerase sigma factor (sigma-70 family)